MKYDETNRNKQVFRLMVKLWGKKPSVYVIILMHVYHITVMLQNMQIIYHVSFRIYIYICGDSVIFWPSHWITMRSLIDV